MSFPVSGDYNRDQWNTIRGIGTILRQLPPEEIRRLEAEIRPYLLFREELEEFQTRYFGKRCRESCFETRLSACCGFESILTFFADHVVHFLVTGVEEESRLLVPLERPNRTSRCVYLGPEGCLWKIRPLSCAMFLCESAKKEVFARHGEAEEAWKGFLAREKDYTWPSRPVLFDEMEAYFIHRGVQSVHLYFHSSPGLLRVKAQAGLSLQISRRMHS